VNVGGGDTVGVGGDIGVGVSEDFAVDGSVISVGVALLVSGAQAPNRKVMRRTMIVGFVFINFL
jgi:hypothetical protein